MRRRDERLQLRRARHKIDTLRRVTETDFPSGLHESYAYDCRGRDAKGQRQG